MDKYEENFIYTDFYGDSHYKEGEPDLDLLAEEKGDNDKS